MACRVDRPYPVAHGQLLEASVEVLRQLARALVWQRRYCEEAD